MRTKYVVSFILLLGACTYFFAMVEASMAKPEFVIDKTKMDISKGTILLIHGTAPQNIDGKLPDQKVQTILKAKDSTHYLLQPTYKELAAALNSFGWDTIRYTRHGVFQDHINFDEYKKVDLKNILDQLKAIWHEIPSDKPKIAFAWSGGSIHVSQLPLSDAAAVIILGGVATKSVDVVKMRAKNDAELRKFEKELNEILSKEGTVKRDEMWGIEMPYGRFFDEYHLDDNWTYFKKYPSLPMLILHGSADNESSIAQAKIWKAKLPDNDITLKIKDNANHAFGLQGNRPDMKDLAKKIDQWLSRKVLKSEPSRPSH